MFSRPAALLRINMTIYNFFFVFELDCLLIVILLFGEW